MNIIKKIVFLALILSTASCNNPASGSGCDELSVYLNANYSKLAEVWSVKTGRTNQIIAESDSNRCAIEMRQLQQLENTSSR